MPDTCLWQTALNVFPAILGLDLLRYAVGAGGVFLVVNIILSRALQRRRIRGDAPPARQLGREILASLRTVGIFALVGTTIVVGAETGVFRVYLGLAPHGVWYLAFSTLLLIVLHDAWFYWTHRLLHYPPLFRRLHRLHHRSYNPSPFTSYSFDTGEAVINAIYLPLVLLILPAHPIALIVFTWHMMIRNALGHCGYEVFPANAKGHPLFGWMTTVTHHDLHHAHAGYNMGLYFSWWDRWMGTQHPGYLNEFTRVAHRLTP